MNCERETAYACEKSGANEIEVLHTLRFLEGTTHLKDYDFVVLIGGFLDGDYLGSARVGANRFKYGISESVNLKEQFLDFIESGKLILGICNGFQLLIKLGLLPDESQAFSDQVVSLTQNRKGRFENRWVNLKINPQSNCVFTENLEHLYLPVRHGEGRLVVTDSEVQRSLVDQNLITMFYADKHGEATDVYPYNPNGSWNNIAAISNKKGNIMGLMPHPEAYNHYTNHPQWTRMTFTEEDGEGLSIFKNAYQYLDQL